MSEFPKTSAFDRAARMLVEDHARAMQTSEEIARKIAAHTDLDAIYHRLQALMNEVSDPHILMELQDISNELYGYLR